MSDQGMLIAAGFFCFLVGLAFGLLLAAALIGFQPAGIIRKGERDDKPREI